MRNSILSRCSRATDTADFIDVVTGRGFHNRAQESGQSDIFVPLPPVHLDVIRLAGEQSPAAVIESDWRNRHCVINGFRSGDMRREWCSRANLASSLYRGLDQNISKSDKLETRRNERDAIISQFSCVQSGGQSGFCQGTGRRRCSEPLTLCHHRHFFVLSGMRHVPKRSRFRDRGNDTRCLSHDRSCVRHCLRPPASQSVLCGNAAAIVRHRPCRGISMQGSRSVRPCWQQRE